MIRKGVKALVFDFDNTAYRFPENKDSIFCNSAAISAIKLGYQGGMEDALAVASKSFEEHGSEATLFCLEHGIPWKDLYTERHSVGSVMMVDALSRDKCLTSAFNKLSQNFDLVILSHATQEWLDRIVPHLGYDEFLDDDKILGLDSEIVSFCKKNAGTEVYEIIASMLNLDPDEIAVVEDTILNLYPAHQLGMQTFLVHWGEPLEKLPNFVDAQIKTIADLCPG